MDSCRCRLGAREGEDVGGGVEVMVMMMDTVADEDGGVD